MDNTMFKSLIKALENNPEALHALLCDDCTHPALEDVLGERERAFVSAMEPKRRLELAFMKDHLDELARRDAVAACVDSCGALTCACTTGTCGGGTCGYTTAAFGFVDPSHSESLPNIAELSCGGDVTCSCTTGTCGGVTCGGSTCSATCTGNSCGNTCGDSCGHTTNFENSFDSIRRWRIQTFR